MEEEQGAASSRDKQDDGEKVLKIEGVEPTMEEEDEDDELKKAVQEATDQFQKGCTYFLQVVKALPELYCSQLLPEQITSHLEVIAKIMHGKDKEVLDIIRNDVPLAKKLWQFVMDSSEIILKGVLDQKKKLENKPEIETVRMLQENRRDVRAAFAAIINFVAADVGTVTAETYGAIGYQLSGIWHEGLLDEYDGLPYLTMENLTEDIARSQFMLNSGCISLAKLVDRTRKYAFDSPQCSSIFGTLLNLSRIPRVVDDLLICRLENEKEVYLQHLMPALTQKNPPHVRIGISGILKNLSMFPEAHPALLNPRHNFLCCALWPIAGNGDYTNDELLKIPVALYEMLYDGVSAKVERDPNPIVRCNTLDFLYQLCAIRATREALREMEVYCILREYHKWEQNEGLLDLTEQVVNILIQTEDEIGVDDFKKLSLE